MKTHKTPRGWARFQRRLPLQPHIKPHIWDEDGVCDVCGFDGAEWTHLSKIYPESYKKLPPCLTKG